MSDYQSTTFPLPEIPTVLALAGPLRPLAAAAHPLHESVCREVAGRSDRLLKSLGIPGKLMVSIEDGEAKNIPGPMLDLRVNGSPCRTGGEAAHLLERIAIIGDSPHADLQLLVELLINTCLEILKDQPDVLLELTQAEAVARELSKPRRRKGMPRPDWPDTFDLLNVLRALRMPLSLGISIADRQAAVQVIGANAPLWDIPEDLGELLAGALSARSIEIRLPEGRFRELTLAWQEQGGQAFSQLRVNLAKETGLNLPPFSFQTDADLADDQFALQVQHIPGMPVSGLTLENLLEVLEAEIRRQLSRLVVLPRVEAQLTLVDSELRDMVEDRIPLPHLVRELRRRAREEGGLRRLPLILEELLDQPFAAAGAAGLLALN